VFVAEGETAELRSKLRHAQLQHDSDEQALTSLKSDVSTFAGIDDSLKAVATAERQRSTDLQ